MNYCPKCGAKVEETDMFCSNCGATLTTYTNQTYATTVTPSNNEKKKNGFAIAGFICSFFVPLLGWVFGGIGLGQSKKCHSGRGLSIWAIVIASINYVVALIYLLCL